MRIKIKGIYYIFCILLILLLTIFPSVAKQGAIQGLKLSANVLVPSLFPFTVCVLMIIKYGFSAKNNILNNVLYKFFGQNFDMFFVFIMSMLGGYPIGAKLINALYDDKIIDKKTANIMLMYCVNAGPAFIITVVGGALNSKKMGIILLVSHICTSVIFALVFGNKLKKHNRWYKFKKISTKPISCIFVESVNDASESIINICAFVTVFSVINSYFDCFFANTSIIKYLSYLTEITYAVSKEKNVFFISFLLGFSGLSIWCQLFALTKSFKVNFFNFALGRVFHGTISFFLTKLLLKMFKIEIDVFSNKINYEINLLHSNIYLFFSMLIMLIVLLIYIYSKNNSGKLLKDVV